MTQAGVVLPAVVLAMCLCACGVAESPDQPDAAAVSEGAYSNEYFGLTVPIPDGWFVASKDTEEYIQELGKGIAGDDASVRAAIEASKETTFQLLTLSEFEMGAPVEFNTNLIIMAERVSHLPGIKSGSDYLFHAGKLLLMTQLPYKRIRDAYPMKLGDREWDRADWLIDAPQMPIEQAYLAVKKDDYVLVVILSARSEEQMDALEQIAATIILE